MVLEKLGNSLASVVRKITFASLVDEKLVGEVVKDIQRALLVADVNVRLVMELSAKIEGRALKEKPRAGASRKEQVIRIVYEELVSMLGRKRDFAPTKSRIMLVGLQGSGKTTTVVKLAKFYLKRGLKPFIIAGDTFRPAAYEQLSQLAEPLNIGVYGKPGGNSIAKLGRETRALADAIEVLKSGLGEARNSDVIILDTAGRHKSEKELFDEMHKLSEIYKPNEKLLIIDSNIGQQAGAQARAFHEAIGITGLILTKLDGSAKGGGALSVAEISPVLFIGTGEKIDNLELFDPDRFISRLLGMGDIASLLEKAKEATSEDEAEKFLKGDLSLLELQSQMLAIKKMGPFSSLINMVPGLGMQIPKEASKVTEEKMEKFLVVMNSMTAEEKTDPKIIDSSRIRRIARGAGKSAEDVKELMEYHKTMKRAFKTLKKARIGRGPFAKMPKEFR